MIRRRKSAEPVAPGQALNADKAPGGANGTANDTTNQQSAQEQPTPLPVIPADIPEALKALHQWVDWRYIWVEGKGDKEGHWTKRPYQPSGYSASVTNPQHYSEFAEVMAAYNEGGFNGVGFVLTANDPFVGVDIDHCLVDGIITEEARGIIEMLDSYTERSPSGNGLRVFVLASIANSFKKPEIEMYVSGRYLTITGQRWPL